MIPVTKQNSVNASQQTACPGSCSGSCGETERGETHGHVLFLRAHLPGPFLLRNAAPHRQLTAKEMREEKSDWRRPSGKGRVEGGGGGRRQGAARQNVLTNEIGHHKGGNVPLALRLRASISLPVRFPEAARLRGLRRKCHGFQQRPRASSRQWLWREGGVFCAPPRTLCDHVALNVAY